MKKLFIIVIGIILLFEVSCGQDQFIKIKEQGSFSVGGTIVSAEGNFDARNPFNNQGQTLHGDHAYVFYQKPEDARKYPIVFLHGAGQSSKSFETTADQREGYQNIFLKKGYSIYLLD